MWSLIVFINSFQGQDQVTILPCTKITVIKVAVEGAEPFTYQWYKDGSPLTDSRCYGGVKSAELTIKDIFSLFGSYHCRVENHYCQSVKSKPFEYSELMLYYIAIPGFSLGARPFFRGQKKGEKRFSFP